MVVSTYGISRGHLPRLQNRLKRLYLADPGDARDRSTPEASQRLRPWTLKKIPLLLCSTLSGFLALGPTMLTLGQRPRTVRYTSPPVLSFRLVPPW